MGVNFFKRNPRDAKFVLFEHFKVDEFQVYGKYSDFNRKTINMIVDEALKFAKEVMGPTMQDGDIAGCQYESGKVIFPESYHQVWRLMKETGWFGIHNSPEYGGQGLPMVVAGVIGEFFQGANCTIATGAELTVGAAGLIESFGTDKHKELFLEKMYSGQWGGTMALTEPEAGSDVGLISTRAIPESNSEETRIYRIEGKKQFITWGEQDLTENIIHLVLARIEGAPSGTRGLSLFIVPKHWVEDDGSLGESNDVFCSGIEHKMGQNASSTCSMDFGSKGQCRGILLGESTSGIAKMFQMMKEMRLNTGLQGMAMASAAYDTASEYAKSRIQGSPFMDRKAGQVPIVQHEDVRRMLMNLKAGSEALRAFFCKVFYLSDQGHYDPDESVRKEALRKLDFYIPIVKNSGADFSFELIRDAIQILGGVGYCKDFPVEQYARDCKITSIVEGTSYIQTNDLVNRQLGIGRGGDNTILLDWYNDTRAFGESHRKDLDFSVDSKLLVETAEATKKIADTLVSYFTGNEPRLIPLNATRLLECLAEVTMGRLMIEQGLIARNKLETIKPNNPDAVFYRGKVETAHYFCRNFLPRVFSRQRIVELADCSAIQIPEAAL